MLNVMVADPSIESVPRQTTSVSTVARPPVSPDTNGHAEISFNPAAALAHLERDRREAYEHLLTQFSAQQDIGLRH